MIFMSSMVRSLACLLLVACVPPHLGCAHGSIVWRGDFTFTQNERDAIERGNQYLAHKMGAEPYDITWDGPHQWPGVACTGKYQIVRGGLAIPDGGLYKDECVYIGPLA